MYDRLMQLPASRRSVLKGAATAGSLPAACSPRALATAPLGFVVMGVGVSFEGDVRGKGLAAEMRDWVAKQIDGGDYAGSLKAPVRPWSGKPPRISIDGDCHPFSYRTDVF